LTRWHLADGHRDQHAGRGGAHLIWTMPSVGAEVLENYERMAEPAERQPKGKPPTEAALRVFRN
jgi:hypothetical protein